MVVRGSAGIPGSGALHAGLKRTAVGVPPGDRRSFSTAPYHPFYDFAFDMARIMLHFTGHNYPAMFLATTVTGLPAFVLLVTKYRTAGRATLAPGKLRRGLGAPSRRVPHRRDKSGGEMQASKRRIHELLGPSVQFVVPVFQRDYSWTEDECEQLWEDLMRIGGSQREEEHFFGSLVYIATRDQGAAFTKWLLVDGQQRLTTISLLMAAMRDRSRLVRGNGLADQFEDQLPCQSARRQQSTKEIGTEGPRRHNFAVDRGRYTQLGP